MIAPDVQKHVPWVLWPGTLLARTQVAERCLRAGTDAALTHDHFYHSVLGLLDVRSSTYRTQLMPLPAAALQRVKMPQHRGFETIARAWNAACASSPQERHTHNPGQPPKATLRPDTPVVRHRLFAARLAGRVATNRLSAGGLPGCRAAARGLLAGPDLAGGFCAGFCRGVRDGH
jgi:hypothetical protein